MAARPRRTVVRRDAALPGAAQLSPSRPDAAGQGRDAETKRAVAPGDPDWLLTVLTVSGPTQDVARFAAAARGTNAIPWRLDLDHEEMRLLAPMASVGPEARALARQLREVIAARHDRVLARWREDGACPLDLHRLLPIPDPILQLGDDHPVAQDWLRTHWGTTQPLRAVRLREDGAVRRQRRAARAVYEFRSADWTPWQAIRRLRLLWPNLVLAAQPRYDDG